jgi:hypothetical protein
MNARTQVHNTFSSRSCLWAHVAEQKFNTRLEWVYSKIILCTAQDRHKSVILGTAQGGHEWEQNETIY